MALNVLIVDDSTVMRSMIIRVLRLSGVPDGPEQPPPPSPTAEIKLGLEAGSAAVRLYLS
jgi:hypothetical protein